MQSIKQTASLFKSFTKKEKKKKACNIGLHTIEQNWLKTQNLSDDC